MTVATDDIVTYLARHGDDCLVLAQRLAGWSSRAPDLEEDIALTNIALDLLGQARFFYSLAGERENRGRTEDDFAFFRTDRQFTNLLLVEQPNGDFATTMVRQLFFDAYQLCLYEGLSASEDTELAGLAGKAVKETRYHFTHSSTWVIRLGDGTDESHRRTQDAIDGLWQFTAELWSGDDVDQRLGSAGLAADPSSFAEPWWTLVSATFSEATVQRPGDDFQRSGGRSGVHTEHLGYLLSELQVLQRTWPDLSW